jgi:hypothetical protein
MNDLLIENLAEIATPLGATPRRGADQAAVLRLRADADGADGSGVEILCRDGRLAFVGPASERERLWGELAGVPRLDGGGELQQCLLALARRRAAPLAERTGGRGIRPVDVLLPGDRSRGDHLAGGRVDDVTAGICRRVDELPSDVVAQHAWGVRHEFLR